MMSICTFTKMIVIVHTGPGTCCYDKNVWRYSTRNVLLSRQKIRAQGSCCKKLLVISQNLEMCGTCLCERKNNTRLNTIYLKSCLMYPDDIVI